MEVATIQVDGRSVTAQKPRSHLPEGNKKAAKEESSKRDECRRKGTYMERSNPKQQFNRRISEIIPSEFMTVVPNGTLISIGAPRFLGVSVVFTLAWCLLYTSALTPNGLFPILDDRALRLAFYSTVALCTAAGFTAPKLVSSLLASKRSAVAFYLLFVMGSLASFGGNAFSCAWACVAGVVLIAIAYSWFVFLWGCIFRFLNAKQAARIVMFAFVLGAFIFLIIAFLSSPMSLVVFIMLPAASLATAFSCMRSLPDKPRIMDIGHASASHRDLVAFTALFSLACGYALSHQSPDHAGEGSAALFIGIIATFSALLLIDAISARTREQQPLRLALSALAIIGGLLMLDAVPSELKGLPIALITIATLTVDSLFWSELATMAGETHAIAFKLFCKNLLCIQLAKLAGACLGLIVQALDSTVAGATVFSPIVAYVFILCIVAIWWLGAHRLLNEAALHSRQSDSSPCAKPRTSQYAQEDREGKATAGDENASTGTGNDPSGKTCRNIAAAHDLTPREEEVLELLARGRSASYIQKELFISLGTAKTHIRHIYRKLDIHSKQELLDLMEKASPTPS